MTDVSGAERGFDHLVLCVDDLDAARSLYQALGFTTTPNAVHPFGTGNFLIQLQGCFLELLTVVDPAKINPPAPGAFGFAAYNRRYLKRRQGFSMLALRSRDAGGDRASVVAAGLQSYPVFDFERQARLPDGTTVTVGFSLAFVTDPRMPEAVFFFCQHRHPPEYFWKAAYQRHANGAARVREVIMVADDPSDLERFFAGLCGAGAIEVARNALTVNAGSGSIVVLTPGGFQRRCPGMATANPPAGGYLAGFQVEVDGLDDLQGRLRERGVPFRRQSDSDGRPTLQIGADVACGVVIEFVAPLTLPAGSP